MCKVFKLSKSGYYHWKDRKPSARSIETGEITREIHTLYQESKGRYGSPKITHQLKERGWKVSRPRVARIMYSEGIRSVICKKFRVTTTDSNHRYPVAENLLQRDFYAGRPGIKWVSDITYIPTDQGWLYLTIILDLYDRKIIGWSLSTDMTTQNTVLAAWRMSLKNRPVDKELMKHTHFHSILQARNEIFEFIEVWYNRKRKHEYLGFMTPEQFGKINHSKCA